MAADDTNPAKILFWDTEISSIQLKINTYSLKNFTSYFSPDTIARDWVMLGAAWKWLGHPVNCISVKASDPFNDYMVIKTLHDVLSEADIIIAHNGDKFDIKKFNTRAIAYGLPPIEPKKSVDTLKIARRRFAFTSNKLSYLAKFLGVESKDESPDWDKVLAGDEQELRYMRQYNRKDVTVLEQVYYKLRGWDNNHPNVNSFAQNAIERIACCPSCGSHDTISRGLRRSEKTAKPIAKRHSCVPCGRNFSVKL